MTTPNGNFHEVGLDDLFFSTTDKKGVIAQANQVFCDYARSTREALIGAPHNIIRHPEMPGGVFRLMWEMIGRGKPICAYVLNLAGDGSSYWAFATITPIEGGYISVRSRPCNDKVQALVAEIYQRVRGIERGVMDKGESPARAARIGESALIEELKTLGYQSYDEFMADCLPAEISARAAAGAAVPSRPGASGNNRALLDSVADMEGLISALAGDLSNADALASDLDMQVSQTLDSLGALEESLAKAGEIARANEDDAPVLASATPALEQQCHQVAETMRTVLTHADAMCALRHQLRFYVGLGQMQAETVCRFAIATIDGKEDPETSAHATESLISVLSGGVASLQTSLGEDREKVGEMVNEVALAESNLRKTGLLLGRWVEMVKKFRLDHEMGEILPTLTSTLGRLGDNLAALHETAEKFSSSTVGFDAGRLSDRMNQALGCSAALV